MIATILAAHVVVAAVVVLLAARLGPRVMRGAAVAPASTLVWLAVEHERILGGSPPTEHYGWLSELGLEITVRVDALSGVMLAIVAGIGVLVLLYAAAYVEDDDHTAVRRLGGGLTGFAAAMTGLVVVDDLLSLYVFWELTSIASYVLIGTHDVEEEARAAAQQALLVTAAGGLAMLAGFVLIGQAAGTFRISAILAEPPTGAVAAGGFLLTLAGVFTKSAQVPFHGWLPAAMAAPTPASTYLHSATMVKAGVYLAARLAPAAVVVTGLWQPLVVGVGLVTLVHGAAMALGQYDLKRLLAYGTISQLGLMVALFGAGIPALAAAGLAVLVAHALYKASLFMFVGAVDHATGSRDIRELPSIRGLPALFGVGLAAAASMAGLPPLLGYVAKEAALEELLHAGLGSLPVVAFVVGAALTVAYSGWFALGGLGGSRAAGQGAPAAGSSPHRPATALVAAPGLLAAGSVVVGVLPFLLDGALPPAAEATAAGAGEAAHLSLWHGLTPALGLTAASVAAGGILAVWRRRWTRTPRLPGIPTAERAFQGVVAGGVRLASRVTRIVQHGSLPLYLAVIALTAVVLPAGAVLGAELGLGALDLDGTALQTAVAALMVLAALGMAVTRVRLGAVVLLGVVGLGMTTLFVMQGAPDLALTQLTVEVLGLLVFVLVLGRLPGRFRLPRWRLGSAARIVIATTVGVVVAGLTVLASAVRHPSPMSSEYIARALPEAGGHNIVNTILVDFRALDTLGEITVLTVVAFGVASLVAARVPDPARVPTTPPIGHSADSVVLSTVVRTAYPLALVFSLYLLVAGHDAPGGGFVGGLAASAALVLRYLDGGAAAVRRALPISAGLLLGVGLSAAVVVGLAGLVWGEALLTATSVTLDLPLAGTVKLGSYTLFDGGVYLVVVGFVLALLRTLGEHYETPRGEVPPTEPLQASSP